MSPTMQQLVIYAALFGIILAGYLILRRRGETRTVALRDTAIEAGLTEPASLHPLIDRARCMGCGACVAACPEGTVLGLIGGKAELVEPTLCIGHGACKAACPFDAISLVFGTATRGIDLPVVAPDFQSNVRGIYIAGELGGMGLIRNAIEQGRQAIESIGKRAARGTGELDVVIVGGGPAGISASLGAIASKLTFVTIEQDSLGGTVAHYPRGKIVMTAPVDLPLIGKVRMRETKKEDLLRFWEKVRRRTGLRINFGERVESIAPAGAGFEVVTTRNRYRAANILLAIGRRGTPRRLDVPGEDLPKVVFRLVDAEQYRGRRVLVVGGGDSALEAAVALAEQPGTDVALAYRGDAIGRAKPKNRKAIDAAVADRRLELLLRTRVVSIDATEVVLAQDGEEFLLPNDAVIVCAGGILPTDFLKSMGIEIETKFGTA